MIKPNTAMAEVGSGLTQKGDGRGTGEGQSAGPADPAGRRSTDRGACQALLVQAAQDAGLQEQLSRGLLASENQALAEPDTLSALLSSSVTASARSCPAAPMEISTLSNATLRLLRLLVA